jgi:7-cyano-7-deazaguanosine (preQ0) biosynthesis protein QueE
MVRLSRLPSGEPEIFASIQGEGVSCGTPSVFVRLALCNLRCTWCDTAYTWDWRRYDQAQETMALAGTEVVERVLALAGSAMTNAGGERRIVTNVVFTGGEPLVQQGELAPLVAALRAAGMRIEVETNATIVPDAALAVDQWNVSPKLANSGNDASARLVDPALAWFAAVPHAYFKFVVVHAEDISEVKALVARLGLPPQRVLLMPEAVDAPTLLERSRWVVEQCCATGYRVGPRLHVALWGAARGR